MFEALAQTPDGTSAANVLQTADRAAVPEAVKVALDAAGIDMPFETQVTLLHDQTEEVDGSRGRQCEVWPKRRDGGRPRPAGDASGRRAAPAGAAERA